MKLLIINKINIKINISQHKYIINYIVSNNYIKIMNYLINNGNKNTKKT